jgi:ferredoxin
MHTATLPSKESPKLILFNGLPLNSDSTEQVYFLVYPLVILCFSVILPYTFFRSNCGQLFLIVPRGICLTVCPLPELAAVTYSMPNHNETPPQGIAFLNASTCTSCNFFFFMNQRLYPEAFNTPIQAIVRNLGDLILELVFKIPPRLFVQGSLINNLSTHASPFSACRPCNISIHMRA